MGYNYPGEMVDLGGNRGWLDRAAAESIWRIDRALGHLLQITEAGRTWTQQNKHWLTFQRNGWPIALSPDTPSEHQKGKAVDSNEAQRILRIMEDHGWRRTVYRWVDGVWTLVEEWHFEYFAHLDNHRNDPAPAGGGTATPIPKEWDEMASKDEIKAALGEVLAGSKPNDRFLVAYASDGPRNGIVLAGMGYWHPLSGEKWEHFNWLKSAQGRTLFQGLEVFTPTNDRSWDILREICQNDGVIDGDVVDYARIGELVTKVDVDEVALAAQLTPALVAAMSNHVGTLTDATITSLVKTLLDEQSKRLAA